MSLRKFFTDKLPFWLRGFQWLFNGPHLGALEGPRQMSRACLLAVFAGAVLAWEASAGFITAPSYPVGASPVSVVAADFNNDGILDLVVANSGDNTVSVLLGKGDGSFQPAVSFAAGTFPTSVAVGDFNGDGQLDLAVTNVGDSSGHGTGVSILLGNGDGTFQAPQTYAAGPYPRFVAVGDFNGDGAADLAVVNPYDTASQGKVAILLGDGHGHFQTAASYPADWRAWSAAVGDFNGDGHLDLAFVNLDSNTVSIWLGAGDGSFQVAQNYAVGSTPSSVAAADFNGDGILDLAVANSAYFYGRSNITILLGKGDGTFQTAREYDLLGGANAVAVADLNHDGQLDLAVTGPYGDNESVGEWRRYFPCGPDHDACGFLRRNRRLQRRRPTRLRRGYRRLQRQWRNRFRRPKWDCKPGDCFAWTGGWNIHGCSDLHGLTRPAGSGRF
jgi:hypothetical protein